MTVAWLVCPPPPPPHSAPPPPGLRPGGLPGPHPSAPGLVGRRPGVLASPCTRFWEGGREGGREGGSLGEGGREGEGDIYFCAGPAESRTLMRVFKSKLCLSKVYYLSWRKYNCCQWCEFIVSSIGSSDYDVSGHRRFRFFVEGLVFLP